MNGRLLVMADRLVDGTGAAPISDVAVRVIDGRIAAIEQHGPTWAPDDGWQVVDGRGMTVLPGLIDAHVHLAFPEPDQPIDVAALERGAEARAAAALAGGVTTVRDLGSASGIALRLRDRIAAGEASGPRILAAGPPITITGGHCHWLGEIADGPDELLAAVDRVAAMGVDVIKIMATGGMATPASDPWTPQYSLEALKPAVARAHAHGLRVATHVLCTAGVRNAVGAGVDTIEHGWTITGRRQDFEPTVVDEIARSGAFGSVSAHDALRDLLPDAPGGGDLAEMRRRLVPHRAMRAAGVPMVVHSDAGPGPTRFDDFVASVRVFAAGMVVTPVEAIQAATGIPARALGLEQELGTVEVGRLADLILVDGDASTRLPRREQVRRVIQGGKTVSFGEATAATAP